MFNGWWSQTENYHGEVLKKFKSIPCMKRESVHLAENSSRLVSGENGNGAVQLESCVNKKDHHGDRV